MRPMTFVSIAKLAVDLAVFFTTYSKMINVSVQADCQPRLTDLVEKPRVRVETENFLPEKDMTAAWHANAMLPQRLGY